MKSRPKKSRQPWFSRFTHRSTRIGLPRPRTALFEPLEDRRMLALASPPIQPLATGAAPIDVALGLLNADPYEDLAALNSDGSLSVALNRGDNNWQSKQTTALGLGSLYGMALYLRPGDSLADLAVQGASAVTVLANDGAGGWSSAQTLTSPAAGSFAPADGGRVKLAAALLNADSVFDLAVPSPGTGEVVVYLASASGSLGAGVRYATGGSQPIAVVAGQFVGDSSPDLAVAHRDGSVSFLQRAGNGSFTLLSGSTVTGLGTITDLVAGDYNGDGEEDLVVTAGDRVTLLTNNRDPVSKPLIANGDFAQGLSSWTTEVLGNAGGTTPGVVSGLGGMAQLRENESFLVSLKQTFVVPPSPQTVAFDLASIGLDDPA